mmetsp:Transcript_20162/g.47203  ORF Transcript_20162/g.47203 Transcript_20162/m.47203 type:complete len:160 (+) Transcript_20162:228-707(+)
MLHSNHSAPGDDDENCHYYFAACDGHNLIVAAGVNDENAFGNKQNKNLQQEITPCNTDRMLLALRVAIFCIWGLWTMCVWCNAFIYLTSETIPHSTKKFWVKLTIVQTAWFVFAMSLVVDSSCQRFVFLYWWEWNRKRSPITNIILVATFLVILCGAMI